MKLHFDIISQDIIDKYKLTYISQNRKVYIDIWKVMYGIP